MINFRKTPDKKPIKDPIAAFRAPFLLFLFTISSPKKAPKKGPINRPKGPKNNIPTNSPNEAPYVLPFPPPNFFAPIIGIKISSKKISSAIEKLITRKLVEILTYDTKLSVKRPIHEVIGPGMIGRKLPTIPSNIKNPAKQIKRRSISFIIDLD